MGQAFSFKSSCFCYECNGMVCTSKPHLELKTQPRFCPPSLSLSMLTPKRGWFWVEQQLTDSLFTIKSWCSVLSTSEGLSCLVGVWDHISILLMYYVYDYKPQLLLTITFFSILQWFKFGIFLKITLLTGFLGCFNLLVSTGIYAFDTKIYRFYPYKQ